MLLIVVQRNRSIQAGNNIDEENAALKDFLFHNFSKKMGKSFSLLVLLLIKSGGK